MSEYQEIPIKFLSISSSENQGSIESSNAEAGGGDEEFYEEIEAPKFVDFTVPDHYRPDDHYWFCLRVGCDQKHEKEMDSEEVYKNFVLRVMAARSPNVKFRRALDRNASRTPIKCPLSAPPKSSKPRLSRMAIISSFSKKIADDKKRVVKPLSKSRSTPLTKMKPVAAKYLTTPRNKRSIQNQNGFRSVQNTKPVNVEVEKGRVVAKALVFRSPKKVKVKTSVELRTPISKLCEGMNKLEIASQKKLALGCSSKTTKNLYNGLSRRQLSSCKVEGTPEEPQSGKNKEAKSGKSVKSKIKGQLSQQASKKLLQRDETQSTKNVIVEIKLDESSHEEECVSSTAPLATHDSDLATPDDSKRDADVEGSENSRSQGAKGEENNCDNNCDNKSGCLTLENSEESGDQLNAINHLEGERNGEFIDSDDKENAPASDGNRINNNLKQSGRKIFGLHEKSSQVQKKITQHVPNKNLKEGSTGTAMKLKKPKPTNPKPFRLRTDERGILKEASLERRTDSLAPQSDTANLCVKIQRKQVNDIQKGSTIVGLNTPKGQERSKSALAAASVTPQSNKHRCNAMQRLEKFRKITSPHPKPSVRPQGAAPTKHDIVSTKRQLVSYLIPGQKLDVIPEASPEVASEARRVEKPTQRRPVTVAMDPSPLSTHETRICTKKLK